MAEATSDERPERKVLLLGSSVFTFSQSDEAGKVAAMVVAELSRTAPQVTWRCRGELLYETPQTAARALELTDRYEPDVVVFDLGTYQFLHAAVMIRIRKRWPRLYPAVRYLSEHVNRLGENKLHGGTKTRGLIYRLPRRALLAFIGQEVQQTPQASLDYAFAAFDALLRKEQLALVCSMPKFYWDEPDMDWCRAQIRVAADGLAAYCERRHVPRYDLGAELAVAGRAWGLVRDGVHYDRATAEFEAGLIAERVLEALDVRAASAAATTR